MTTDPITNTSNPSENQTKYLDPVAMSPADFAALGLGQVAYLIKVTTSEGTPAYAIRAANGEDMAVIEDAAVAVAAIRQHELQPVSVH